MKDNKLNYYDGLINLYSKFDLKLAVGYLKYIGYNCTVYHYPIREELRKAIENKQPSMHFEFDNIVWKVKP